MMQENLVIGSDDSKHAWSKRLVDNNSAYNLNQK